MSNKVSGACLCGAVKVSTQSMDSDVHVCHCSMCRKWSGAPVLSVDCGTDMTFEGEENVTGYSSSEWAERGFCSKCGTHLYYKLKANGQYIVSPELFDDPGQLKLVEQIFIDEKPGYYSFTEKTENLTGEQVFAKYAPPQE